VCLAVSAWAATPASVVLPPTPVGASSAATNITFTFTAATTVASVKVLFLGAPSLDYTAGAGGTCVNTFTKNATCTVPVIFKPSAMGNRLGAVELIGGNGAVLQTVFLSGIGQGAGANYSASQRISIGTYTDNPAALAFDANGDLYVADFPYVSNDTGRVVKIPLLNGTFNTPGETVISNPAGGPTLDNPSGLAFDGAGNLYVADFYDSEIIEMPADGSANVIVTSSLNNPAGLAVDGAGDLFIADQENNRVVELPNQNGKLNAAAAITLGSATDPLNQPADVAFDGSGNLIIADWGNGRIVKIPLQSGTLNSAAQTTLVNDVGGQPSALSLDAASNLYIALEQALAIEVVPFQSGSYNTNAAYLLDKNLVFPDAIKVDGNGNVVYADTGGALTYEVDTVHPPALSFPQTGIGQTSASQRVPLINIGNQPLSISSIAFATNFPNLGSTCTGTLAAGASCLLASGYAATALGVQSGSATITDNAVNQPAGPQTIAMTGTGVPGPQTILLTPVTGLTYGGAPVTLGASGGGSGNPVTLVVTSGPGTLNGSNLTATGVGPITITANQAGNTNYLAAPTVTEVITAAPAVLTVTAANASIAFGSSLPSNFAYAITGFVNGDTSAVVHGAPNLTTNAQPTSSAGTYTITPSFGTLSATNYNFVFVPGTLTITPAQLSGTWSPSTTALVYGQPLGSGVLDPTSATAGTWSFSVAGVGTVNVNTVLPAGSYTITATETPFDTIDFAKVTVTQTITVAKALLTVNATSVSSVFGIVPVLNQYTFSGFVNGDNASVVSGTPVLSAVGLTLLSPVGTYPIAVSVAGMSAANYTLVGGTGATVSVGKATPRTSWPLPGPTTFVYGGTLAGWLNVSSSVPGSWTLTYNGSPTDSTRVPTVGNQVLTAIFTPTDTTDYTNVILNTFITVVPATLTVTANSVRTGFGSALPAFGYTITGFVAGDNATAVSGTPTLTTTATAGSPAGNYPINISTAGMSSPAYTFTGVPGTLTIVPVAPSASLAAASAGLTYGQQFGVDVLTSSSVPGTWSFTANGVAVTAASILPAGSYAVVGTFVPTDTVDYTIVTATLPGTIQVAPAPLTITANNASMVAGSPLPSFGFSVAGLVNGDTQASALSGAPLVTTTADATSPAGTYPITISAGSLTAANYTLTFVPGVLTITAASALPYSAATSLQRDFNFHPIKAGETLWFAASIDADAAQDGTIVAFQHAVVAFTVNGVPVSLNVPNGTVTFSAAATVASTSFDPVTKTWNTIAPLPGTGSVFPPGAPCPPGLGLARAVAPAAPAACGAQQVFIAGFALPMTAALRGNVDDVTWSGTLATNNASLVATWQWSATSYSEFSTDNNALGVVAAPTSGPGADPAGTPDNFERFARPGGTLPGDADDSRSAAVRFKN